MTVVVHHGDAAPRPEHLEATVGSREGSEHALGSLGRDSREDERLVRGGRVSAVVLAGDRERERDRVEQLAADDLGHLGEPRIEAGAELRDRGPARMVVELDVRQHREPGTELEHGAIRLVALDDQPAGARACVAAELRHDAADDPGRVVAGLLQAERDHGRGRRLPVRTGDDDRGSRGDELREERRSRRPARRGRDGRSRRSLPSPGAAAARRRGRSRIPPSVSEKIVSRASQPRTSAPHARATFAYADIPEPAIPTK